MVPYRPAAGKGATKSTAAGAAWLAATHKAADEAAPVEVVEEAGGGSCGGGCRCRGSCASLGGACGGGSCGEGGGSG